MSSFSTAAKALRGPFKKLIAKLALTLRKVLIRKPGKRCYPSLPEAKDAIKRDVRDPSSLRGATTEEVRRLVPEHWATPTSKAVDNAGVII